MLLILAYRKPPGDFYLVYNILKYVYDIIGLFSFYSLGVGF